MGTFGGKWSVYIFDVIVEGTGLFIVTLNVPLVYKSRGDAYNIWMMVIIFLKSVFILVFSLVYIFLAWKNFLFAKRTNQPANPNKAEQYFYDETDDKDEDFVKIMNNTENPLFNETNEKLNLIEEK